MNNLKKLRLQRKLTIRELGEEVNIAFGTISMLENGVRDFTTEHLRTLANYFGVTTDYLLGRSSQSTLTNVGAPKNADDNDFLFALSGEVNDLSPELKETILNYVKFVKEEEKKKEK